MTQFRITLIGFGIVLIAAAIFGDELLPGSPGFGPLQWAVLIVGILVIASAFYRRRPKGPAS